MDLLLSRNDAVADVGRGRRTPPFLQQCGGMSNCRPWRGSVRRCRPTPLVSAFPLEAQNRLNRYGLAAYFVPQQSRHQIISQEVTERTIAAAIRPRSVVDQRERGRVRRTDRMVLLWAFRSRAASGAVGAQSGRSLAAICSRSVVGQRERGRVLRTVRMVLLWALRSRAASGAGDFPHVYCHPRVRPIDGWMAYRGSQYLVLL